jgi:hypothetical protein
MVTKNRDEALGPNKRLLLTVPGATRPSRQQSRRSLGGQNRPPPSVPRPSEALS